MGQPTMDDVAARAGVSRALVSLVMRQSPRVSEWSRDKVLLAAQDLGYRPNLWARSLASGQTNTIGVMLNDLHNPFFTEMAEGAAAAANEHQLQILLSSGWQRESGELQAIEAFMNMRTDGLLLAAARVSTEVLESFAKQTPTVAVSTYVDSPHFDTVNNNEEHGGNLIVEHLVGLGHTRIGHIDAGVAPSAPERRNGFTKAMLDRGLAPIVVDGAFDEQAGAAGAAQLLDLHEPPTAIFAGNDLSAIGVLTKLTELGVRVPDDISVVGYDDTILATIGSVSLTTIHQPRRQLGRIAIDLLAERLAGRTDARHELIEPRLVTRSSTGPNPKHRGAN